MKSTTTNNNKSILNFFKPAPNAGAQPQQANSQPQTQQEPQEKATPRQPDPKFQSTSQSSEARDGSQTQSSALSNGKFVVGNSDSEDSDDSDSSLEDLPAVLGRKPTTNTKTSSSRKRTPSRPRRTIKFDASPIPVRPVLRNSMASLVKQAQKEEKEEATREAVRALLNEDIADPGHEEQLNGLNLLEDVMAGEEDDGKLGKILQAMRRQEAGNTESRWFFFDAHGVKEKPGRSNFPQEALRQCSWKSALTSAPKFRQTILRGFADHIVAMGEELPEELLLWMLDEVCFESRNSFRHIYCRIITSHTPRTIMRLMNPGVIQKLFRNVGATEEATITSKPIGTIPKSIKEYQTRSWTPLISLVSLLGSVATGLSTNSRNYSICLLARLCMDNVAVEELALFQAIQDAFKSLITSIPEAYWLNECDAISLSIFKSTELSTLHLQILGCIPDAGIQRLHNLRRQLALALFFNFEEILTQPLSKSLNLASITTYLSTPRFRINSQTDYREFSALICILAIAVADGRYLGLNLENAETADAFNENIDRLINQLENVASGIRDASAAHISRTDAKSTIKLVLLKLGAARTKRKPRVTIWGEETTRGDLQLGNAEMMERFVMKLNKETGE